MNYKFKLSRRLARLRAAVPITTFVLGVACAGDPNAPGSSGADGAGTISISPDSVSLGVNQTVQFEVSTDASAGTATLSRGGSGKGRGHSKPTIVSLALTPQSTTLNTGASNRFSATATLSDGSLTLPSLSWTATGGTVDSTGLFTAGPVPGTYKAIATTSNGVADTATVSVTESAPVVTQLILSPATTTLVEGASKQFSAVGKASDGSTVGVSPAFTATGGTMTSGGVFIAGATAGSFRIIATDSATSVADTSVVTVTEAAPVVTQLILSPASTTLLEGASKQFIAVGKASDGSTVDVSPAFTATGGSVTSAGVYTAGTTPGAFRIIATDSATSLADTSAVTITAPTATLQSVILTPSTVSLTTGGTRQFAATGEMSDNSTSSVAVTWSATGGTISSAGFYTAGSVAGTYRVVGTEIGGTLADTSTVTITAPSPTLQAVVLTPASVTLQTGATQQFAVSGRMSDGSTTTVSATYSATSGTITSGGLYTAGASAGVFRVIAIQQGGTKADTASVTVTVPTPPPSGSCARTVNVGTVSGFTSAVAGALAGDCVLVAPGTYRLSSALTVSRSGTSTAPITIQGGGSNTIIDVAGTAIYFNASYIHLRKLRLTNFGLSGFWTHGATYNVIDSIELDHTQQVGIALKDASHHNVIKNSRIHDTGTLRPYWGEGVYIGNSGDANYPLQFTNTDNQVLNNHFGPNVGAQSVEVKEGSDRTIIRGNFIDGTGTQYVPDQGSATLIAVIASNVVIDNNDIQYGSPDAITFYAPTTVSMVGNVVSNNSINLANIHNFSTRPFYGFNLTVNTNSTSHVTLKCSNTVTNGAFSNMGCTQ
jgi:hypothetical protein